MQAARQVQAAERLENLRQEYMSFLYGFQAVGLDHRLHTPAVPTDLSTEDSALFKTVDLTNIFFRYGTSVTFEGRGRPAVRTVLYAYAMFG